MMLDLAEIEALEARLVNIAYGVISTALIAAVLVGYLLSRLVMKPVSRLTAQVAALRPDTPSIRLRDQFDDREIGLIAEAIDRYQARIEQFVARERDFTDGASHELRTPLATILSALPLLREQTEISASAGRERLDRIERAARQMQAMIEALLFLAREDGGWRTEPCALAELVEEQSQAWRSAAEEKGLELICRVDGSPLVWVSPGMAASVIGNLLANAVQHTQRGQVRIILNEDRLIVEDTGPGISMIDRGRIFERRYRGPGSAGLGIGLYLVHRICERLGWLIEVHTVASEGTRFEIRIGAVGLTKR
jgi:signal transduction histidine kinase